MIKRFRVWCYVGTGSQYRVEDVLEVDVSMCETSDDTDDLLSREWLAWASEQIDGGWEEARG